MSAAGRGGKHSRRRKSSAYTHTHTYTDKQAGRQATHTTPHCLRSVNLPLVLSSCDSSSCCMCCTHVGHVLHVANATLGQLSPSSSPHSLSLSFHIWIYLLWQSIIPDLSSCTQIYATCLRLLRLFLLPPPRALSTPLPTYINCSVFCPFAFHCALFASPWHGNSIKVTNCPNF